VYNCTRDQHVFVLLIGQVKQVMGYEIARFEGEVDEELLCPICSGVLEDPVQVLVTCADRQTYRLTVHCLPALFIH